MSELLKNYIDKDCIIYTINTQLTGIIKEVSDSWISVEIHENVEIINIDYITRIREYPKNKNGKKKSILY